MKKALTFFLFLIIFSSFGFAFLDRRYFITGLTQSSADTLYCHAGSCGGGDDGGNVTPQNLADNLTLYVPYNGATDNINIGGNTFSTLSADSSNMPLHFLLDDGFGGTTSSTFGVADAFIDIDGILSRYDIWTHVDYCWNKAPYGVGDELVCIKNTEADFTIPIKQNGQLLCRKDNTNCFNWNDSSDQRYIQNNTDAQLQNLNLTNNLSFSSTNKIGYFNSNWLGLWGNYGAKAQDRILAYAHDAPATQIYLSAVDGGVTSLRSSSTIYLAPSETQTWGFTTTGMAIYNGVSLWFGQSGSNRVTVTQTDDSHSSITASGLSALAISTNGGNISLLNGSISTGGNITDNVLFSNMTINRRIGVSYFGTCVNSSGYMFIGNLSNLSICKT